MKSPDDPDGLRLTHPVVEGTGAVGALYGSRLWRAGHPVRFCLRSDPEAGLAQGLQGQSPSWGDVVALKTTANRSTISSPGPPPCPATPRACSSTPRPAE